MPDPLYRPPSPIWQPARAPAGCKGYWTFSEGAGGSAAEAAGRSRAATVPPALWVRGPYGPALGAFTNSNRATVPHSPGLAVAAPFWVALLLTVPASGPINFSNILLKTTSSAWNDGFGIHYDSGACKFWVTSYTTSVAGATPPTGVHVLHGEWVPGTVRLYLDGLLAASAAGTSSPTDTAADLLLGDGTPLGGSTFVNGTIHALAIGSGARPDPLALARDWLAGTFAAVRAPRRAWLAAAAAAGAGGGGYRVWYAGSGRGAALGSGVL